MIIFDKFGKINGEWCHIVIDQIEEEQILYIGGAQVKTTRDALKPEN